MTRQLLALPCPSGQAAVDTWWQALADALAGTGPALVPVPSGADAERVNVMAQPGIPLEVPGVALVVPTSGSTGIPKGAMLTAAALTTSVAGTMHWVGGPGRWLLALPVTHIGGLNVITRALLSGERPVAMDLTAGFEPTAFVAATEQLGTGRRYTALVPTQLSRLLSAGPAAVAALASYDAVLLGGAAAAPTLLESARSVGARVMTTYGMSETCGGCVYDGLPLPGVSVQLGDDGRIELGGGVVFAGYRLRPDLTESAFRLRDGQHWHLTQDAGRFDSAGRLEVLGRLDDVITTGGEKVAPTMVEAALAALPGVAEAVVVGVDDAEWGQRVGAAITSTDTATTPTLDELRSALRDTLPPAALPTRLAVLAELPMIGTGKPDRKAVAALLAGR
jgi:O-succinylbenzoic acid--CoA ligase